MSLPLRRVSDVLHQRHGSLVLLQSGLCSVPKFVVVSYEGWDELFGDFDECYEEVGAEAVLVLSQVRGVSSNREPQLKL
jgi:hypothetical protein